MEDGQKVEKYFDDIRFKGEDGLAFSKELKDSILNSYSATSDPLASSSNSSVDSKSKVSAAREVAAETTSAAPTSRERKPLWGF